MTLGYSANCEITQMNELVRSEQKSGGLNDSTKLLIRSGVGKSQWIGSTVFTIAPTA